MEKREWMLWRITLAFYVLALLCLFATMFTGSIVHHPITRRLVLASIIISIPGYIISKFHDRLSRSRIDGLKQIINNFGIQPTQESDYEWLNREKLYMWTQEFDKLGFSRLGDYTVGIGTLNTQEDFLPQSFTRLMANEKQKCFAEISQSKHPKTGLKEMACVITTLFTSGQQCKTSNESAPASAVSMINEFGITPFYLPGATPEKLFLDHIEQRDRMAAQQNLVIQDDVSFESYRQQTVKNINQAQSWIKQKISGISNFQ
jgi:hypothetical protein